MVDILHPADEIVDDQDVPGELLGGVFMVSGSNTPSHAFCVQNVFLQLHPQLPPGWRLIMESVAWVFERGVDQPKPDVMLVPANIEKGIAEVVVTPALAVEVLSPGSVERDLVQKRDLYKRGGVPYWVVDPRHREVHVFTAAGATFHTGGTITLADPPLTLDIDALWED